MLARNGFDLVPLQAFAVRERLGLNGPELLREMRVVTADGESAGGADAIVLLARRIPAARLLYALSRLPGMMPLLRGFYGVVARNRNCGTGACGTGRNRWTLLDALVLATVAAAAVAGGLVRGWMGMWVICLALFLGCKWRVLAIARAEGVRLKWTRRMAFVAGWPGMKVREFAAEPDETGAIGFSTLGRECVGAAMKIVFGALLVWAGVRLVMHQNPLLAGWAGMVGMILILHFGVFDLLAVVWRRRGIRVCPVMRQPLRAKSLGEFWGRRWNTAFHQLAVTFVFHPVRRRLGRRAATMATFAASGMVHDLVISVPAGAGYGWPTAYFVLQGAGVLLEQTRIARRLGVGRGIRGWLFTILVTAGPVFWLFHPAFVTDVMLPFLKVLNAY